MHMKLNYLIYFRLTLVREKKIMLECCEEEDDHQNRLLISTVLTSNNSKNTRGEGAKTKAQNSNNVSHEPVLS